MPQQGFRTAAFAAVAAFTVAGCGSDSTGDDAGPAAGPPAADTARRADLNRQLAGLEHRARLIRDANDIKRLQRAYGYYLDEALWDEMVDLMTDDVTVEYGLGGVYAGRERVHEYLLRLGGGRNGLSHGQLNEHMQLQPVIHVAPDGMTARGRWRAFIMSGVHEESASWGEGPYENEYRKEDGVWKISRIHWYETFNVPYEGGWAAVREAAQAEAAIDADFPPDMPPSEPYEPWPGVYLPPYHYDNPTLAGAPPVPAPASVPAAATQRDLARRAAVLAHEVQLLEDENAIENLQRIYGYYVDKSLWTQVTDLYDDDGILEIGGRGQFIGKPRVTEYLNFLGAEGPMEGRVYDHMQLQPIVNVAPDGMSAKGRWRFFTQNGEWQARQRWGMGVYENEYVKENGIWKIKDLHSYFTMYAMYEGGWAHAAQPNTAPEPTLPPDEPPRVVHETFPAVFNPPFHYENPVTGSPVYAGSPAEHAAQPAPDATLADVEASLAALAPRIGLLEDTDELENLHAIYGYYLDKNQWDDLAALFAEDGTIEIAQRGVYIGRDRVRESLDLYGERGVHYGSLRNHMQLQPVIHVADDGRSARIRSRAFSQLGTHGESGSWHGGVYENEFVKQDGVWKFSRDHVYNTYFAPYDTGWSFGPVQTAPGMSESIPPDAPPTEVFEVFPQVYLPPFHYDNPVTGRQ